MKTSTAKILAVFMMGLGATAAMAAGPGEGRERPTFETLDADGSGEITASDLEAMRTERFTTMDTDGDGSINEAEFVAKAQADAQERAASMFERLDADGDGVLSQDVLQSRSRGRNPERMISRLDTGDVRSVVFANSGRRQPATCSSTATAGMVQMRRQGS